MCPNHIGHLLFTKSPHLFCLCTSVLEISEAAPGAGNQSADALFAPAAM